MRTVAITTLGTTGYTEVVYRFQDGEEIRSSYPVHALVQKSGMRFDQTIVLLTDGARQANWELMKIFLEDRGQTAGEIKDISIPDGANSEEIWQIFEKIAEVVPENANLYIDITHGLRHLPMLLVMAAAYLRTAKNVTIKSLSYGAFELGKREQRDGRSVVTECNVFELLPFVALFDWAGATKVFQETGNASQLARLLRDTGATLGSEARAQIDSIADQLDKVTLALEVARPEEAMQLAHELRTRLDENAVRIRAYAKPFGLLKELLSKAFERVSLPRPEALGDRLHRQRDLIKWYFQRGRIALSAILAREWMISRRMRQRGIRDISDDERRDEIVEELNRGRGPQITQREHEIWRELRKLRNEIAHAGQADREPLTASKIKAKFEYILEQLDRL
ncbi:MAG: TIGR02221 family CRISPR-associated protein [Anaerolineae bacterium]|nr:TIGR02221 family CRISPR-associated protein [Anaerolineae bacterium]